MSETRSLMPLIGKVGNALLASIACGFLFYFLIFAAFPPYSRLEIQVFSDSPEETFQIYYRANAAAAYLHSDVATVKRSGNEFSFLLPAAEIRYLRFDPLTKPGTMRVSKICMRPVDALKNRRCWEREGIEADFIARDHITRFSADRAGVSLENIGTDPFFETKPELESFLYEFISLSASSQAAFCCLLTLCVFVWFLAPTDRTLPAFLGSPPARVLYLAIFILLFLSATESIRRRTPALQGADENDHVARLMSYELGVDCGVVPLELRQYWEKVSYLAHHPEAKWRRAGKGGVIDPQRTERLENGLCRYSSLYLALPSLMNRLLGNSLAGSRIEAYLERTRVSTSFTAAFCFLPAWLLVFFGKSIWRQREEEEIFLRFVGTLCCLYVIFLPQTLWLSSVLNQDYLLIAAGLFLACGVFLRIPFLSDWINILSVAISLSKSAYVLPFLLLVCFHYTGLAFPPWYRRQRKFAIAVLLLFLGIFSGALFSVRQFGAEFCGGEFYCHGLERSGLLGESSALSVELLRMVEEYGVLSIPPLFHWDSAYGNFGWLDAPMPSRYSELYVSPLTWAVGLSFLFILPLMWKFYQNEQRVFESVSVVSYVALAIYWIVSIFVIYLVFVAMWNWCGDGASFGCAYQKRYELPLYPFIAFMLFAFSLETLAQLLNWIFARVSSLQTLFVFLLLSQGFVAGMSFRAQLLTLDARYQPIEKRP